MFLFFNKPRLRHVITQQAIFARLSVLARKERFHNSSLVQNWVLYHQESVIIYIYAGRGGGYGIFEDKENDFSLVGSLGHLLVKWDKVYGSGEHPKSFYWKLF